MNRPYSIMFSLFWLISVVDLAGQRVFEGSGYTFTLDKLSTGLQEIDFTTPVLSGDDTGITLYKTYFNPSSFSAYRNFFLPGDWGDFSQSDFDTWQSRLHSNQMILDKTMELHDQFGNRYVICQFRLITKEYELPGTGIFKRISNQWKHISFVNDKQAYELKKIGLLDDTFISQANEISRSQRLQQLPENVSKAAKEKFDRSFLFEKIRPYLASKNITESDTKIAQALFVEKAEVEMVKFLARDYKLDVYVMMEDLNALLGFTMFKFVQTTKTK